MTDKKCAIQLAQELEGQLKTANHGVARGSYSNQICTEQVKSLDLEATTQPYLDLIPKIELLVVTIIEEVEAAKVRY